MKDEVKNFKNLNKIPVKLSFSENNQSKNSLLTKGQLKVFYIGTTEDGRTFTEQFSKELIKTLPEVPVVGFYDETVEDFVGHNQKQFVYGYVPKDSELSFVVEDGVTYAVTDVILFTGRDDNIGEVASKIIGKSQSLELAPDVEADYITDENGKFKELVYTKGTITGLSILGDGETPAFTGSEFFKKHSQDKEFKELMFSVLKPKKVDTTNFEEIYKGSTLTVDEKTAVLTSKFAEKIGISEYDIIAAELTDNSIVFYNYSEKENMKKYVKVSFDENLNITSDITYVRPRYISKEEIEGLNYSLKNKTNYEEVEMDNQTTEANEELEFTKQELATAKEELEIIKAELNKYKKAEREVLIQNYAEKGLFTKEEVAELEKELENPNFMTILNEKVAINFLNYTAPVPDTSSEEQTQVQNDENNQIGNFSVNPVFDTGNTIGGTGAQTVSYESKDLLNEL